MYQMIAQNGYITSIVKGTDNGNITEEQYNEIMDVISNKPIAPQGHYYKLKENLEWELNELPPIVEGVEE